MTKKITKYIGIVLAIMFVVFVFRSYDTRINTGETVKIGISLPLTGSIAFLGENQQKAAELALKDAGKTKYNYQLIIEDDAFEPANTATVVNKFINIDKVLAFITFGSGTSNSVAPMNEKAKIARFGLASDPTSVVGEYNFIHWTPAYKEGELMAKEIVKRGYKKVAIIDTNHPGTIATTNAIKKGLSSTQVKIVSYDVINIGDKDFRTLIAKIRELHPDLIILEAISPEIELIARQIHEIGMNDVQLTSVEAFESSSQLELFEGMWFISDAIRNDFVEHFKSAYGTVPYAGSAYVYDLVSMLIKTQEDQKTIINSEDLPRLIMKKGFHDSIFFGKVEIDKDGYFVTEASVKKVENGKIVTVE